jgi:hypothetical protein
VCSIERSTAAYFTKAPITTTGCPAPRCTVIRLVLTRMFSGGDPLVIPSLTHQAMQQVPVLMFM